MAVFVESEASAASAPNEANFSFSASLISGLSIFADSFIILVSGIASYAFIVGATEANIEIYLSAICFVFIVGFVLFHYAGLYQFEAIMNPHNYWDKLIVAFAISFFLLLAIAFSLKVSATYSRLWMGVFAMSAGSAIIVARLSIHFVFKRLMDWGIFVRNVVIFGGGEKVDRLLDHINQRGPHFVSVVGVFGSETRPSSQKVLGIPNLGDLNDLQKYARTHKVDDVIIALPFTADEKFAYIVEKIRELPLNVYLASDLVGYQMTFRPSPSHYQNLPMVEIIDKPISDWNIALKLIEDIVLTIFILILLAPLMLVVALAIKIESPGPILFRQRRLGFNNKVFEIYKFRSMRHLNREEGVTKQATPNDRRVTRVGRIIRRLSIDELPQLFNVLNGTMSLVGPRPHAIDHNQFYSEKIRGYFSRHRVKPGITGWAQINGLRGETNDLKKMEARVDYDIYYEENWSLLFDLRILIMTIFVCITGRNAY